MSYILVSLLVPKVVVALISVIVGAFNSILFNFFYRNNSSNCREDDVSHANAR